MPRGKKKQSSQVIDYSTYISPRKVAWTGPDGADLLLIGEAPGADEDRKGTCFIGEAGDKLDVTLARLGIARSNVKVINVCNYRPADNNFAYLEGSPQLEEGKRELLEYIKNFPPKMIVLFGGKALEHVAGCYGIMNYRGTPLEIYNIRCIPTWHPAYILPNRAPEEYPVFLNDLRRAVEHINKPFPSYNYNFTIHPTGLELETCIDEITSSDVITVDIESIKGTTQILCVGFGLSKERAICIINPEFTGMSGSFATAIQRILSHPNKKVFHNGSFDVEMLYVNGIHVENYYWDTMIAQHVLEPDLPKGLDFLCSTETYVPCYWAGVFSEKAWNKTAKRDNLWVYNCKDCTVTYEAYEHQVIDLSNSNLRKLFDYEMSMVPIAEHISRSGMLVDEVRRDEIRQIVREKYINDYRLLAGIAGVDVNIRSPKDSAELLYQLLELPVKRNRKGNVTTDEDAIVSLIAHCKMNLNKYKSADKIAEWTKKLGICMLFLRLREYRKLLSSYIDITISPDGRARSSYKITGTGSGRWSAEKYIDDTGLNMQTIPRGGV